MEDIQSQRDGRGIPIDKVGVSDLRYPIVVLDRDRKKQHTVGRVSLSVSLPHEFKGTHMSRFIEVLNEHHGEMTMRTLPNLLRDLRSRLQAESAHVFVSFPYFVQREAPVSHSKAAIDYDCTFSAEVNNGDFDFILGVRVPITTLCPCSKAISDYGAHNQRGYADIRVRAEQDREGNPALIWIEELIAIADESCSCPVYSLLKRDDERHVTMRAYDNPAFVEDVVRGLSERLMADNRVAWFKVHVRNEESIHNHSAFALVEWARANSTTAKETEAQGQRNARH